MTKFKLKSAGATLLALLLFAEPAGAAINCGEPPLDKPAIPNGKRADRAQLTVAVGTVKKYSEAVDAHLACKDERALVVFQWMNEEQKERWAEDLDTLHQGRVDLQKKMNEAIRIYNSTDAAG